jgi:hypothetical protein
MKITDLKHIFSCRDQFSMLLQNLVIRYVRKLTDLLVYIVGIIHCARYFLLE